MPTITTYRRIVRASVEIVLALVPLVLVGVTVVMVAP
jgi:hypothetical protein